MSNMPYSCAVSGMASNEYFESNAVLRFRILMRRACGLFGNRSGSPKPNGGLWLEQSWDLQLENLKTVDWQQFAETHSDETMKIARDLLHNIRSRQLSPDMTREVLIQLDLGKRELDQLTAAMKAAGADAVYLEILGSLGTTWRSLKEIVLHYQTLQKAGGWLPQVVK